AGPAAPSTRAAAKKIPPHHSADPGAPLRPRKPVEPVRRRWIQERAPNAATRPARNRVSAAAAALSAVMGFLGSSHSSAAVGFSVLSPLVRAATIRVMAPPVM